MRRYFRLLDDVHLPRRGHLGHVFAGNDDSILSLRTGVRLRNDVARVMEVTHPGRSLDFCIATFGAPVATEKLAAAIESIAEQDVQRLPVYIRGHEGFEVLNSLRVLEGVDEKRSVFTKWTEKDHRADLAGNYRSLSVLRLLLANIPKDAHFFRIKGSMIELIVSEDVKLAMEAAGCLGAKFVDVT